MCGIFALLGTKENPNEYFKKGSKRGPEFSKLVNYNGIYLGFHRLLKVIAKLYQLYMNF